MAAASGDSKKFTKASGVGPKLAQRIVLELKDRVKKMGFTGGTLELTGTDDAGIVSASQNAEQAVQALIVLGYTQSEAAQALGIRHSRATRLVVLPQALRIIIPPLTSQFLNLTKNSSLAVAAGYADLVQVGNTILNQSGHSIEIIAIWMIVYVSISLVTSLFMNWFNAKMALVER